MQNRSFMPNDLHLYLQNLGGVSGITNILETFCQILTPFSRGRQYRVEQPSASVSALIPVSNDLARITKSFIRHFKLKFVVCVCDPCQDAKS